MKIQNAAKINNPFYFNQTKGSLYNTPNKIIEGRSIYHQYGDTPLNFNMNVSIPISPFNNNTKNDLNFPNSQKAQKNFVNYLNTFASPGFLDKK